jgi:BNR/Asp-box repeat
VAGALSRIGPWLAVVAVALLAGCGGGDGPGSGDAGDRVAAWVDADGADPRIGSLAVDPADDTLWLSTNRGLYRLRDGGAPQQVTGRLDTPQGSGRISGELVVGFTRQGDLIASGHPSSDSSLPPALGLIASDDEGRTWRSVSELGSSDFHVIETSGRRVAAAQYGEAGILVSDDDGRTWQGRSAPETVVDLAVDPRDSERWVVTTASGVAASTDTGKTWRPVDVVPNGRLAWSLDGTAWRIDPGSEVLRSSDGGKTWQKSGKAGSGEPQALTVTAQGELVAAMADGTVRRSRDEGRSWSLVVGPEG